MPDWPVNGDTDWNTAMKANIDVGHDSDGTHTKSQMLTDMEWSPTAYVGGESITFPNGLIMKQGNLSCAGTSTSVSFAVAFPTGCDRAIAVGADGAVRGGIEVNTQTANGFDVEHSASQVSVWWIAVGH